MTIPAIAAISNLPALTPASPAASGAAASSGGDFGALLGKGLDQIQAAQTNADQLAVKAATGDLTDISSYTIAATQASLVTQLVTSVQSKAVSAFNEIMGMQA